jgi:hypothetical protein
MIMGSSAHLRVNSNTSLDPSLRLKQNIKFRGFVTMSVCEQLISGIHGTSWKAIARFLLQPKISILLTPHWPNFFLSLRVRTKNDHHQPMSLTT